MCELVLFLIYFPESKEYIYISIIIGLCYFLCLSYGTLVFLGFKSEFFLQSQGCIQVVEEKRKKGKMAIPRVICTYVYQAYWVQAQGPWTRISVK